MVIEYDIDYLNEVIRELRKLVNDDENFKATLHWTLEAEYSLKESKGILCNTLTDIFLNKQPKTIEDAIQNFMDYATNEDTSISEITTHLKFSVKNRYDLPKDPEIKMDTSYVVHRFREYHIDKSKISLEEFKKLVEDYGMFSEVTQYLHRLDGAAIVNTLDENADHSDLGYFIWGKHYTKDDYMEAIDFLKENGMEAFILAYKM